MLTRAGHRRGVTLIELLIALVIVAIVMMTGAPAFSSWIQNTQIRNAADMIKTGLVTAQTEALRRNTPVRFQLTSSVGSDCALSNAGTNWVINIGDASTNDPSGKCDAAPSSTAEPFIIGTHAANDGMRNVTVSSDRAVIVFNSYGKVINAGKASTTIDLSNSTGGACAADGGSMTCMRIVVSPSGQIRMCNPKHDPGTPQGC